MTDVLDVFDVPTCPNPKCGQPMDWDRELEAWYCVFCGWMRHTRLDDEEI